MSEYSVVGKRLPRIDALGKVTGTAVFSGDVMFPHMLHGKILRSPYAHARIKRLDVSKAQAMEGVMAVLTASDVPGYRVKNALSFVELPHFSEEKVVYDGQPVAAVAATDVRIAEKALDLIEVEYEELPRVFDPLESIKPSAPLIHQDLYTNAVANPNPEEGDRPSNVAYHLNIVKGDPEAGFQKADRILENTFCTKMIHHGFIEPFAAVASVDAGGKVTVWTSTQGIFMTQQMLAHYLDLPLERIKVVPVEIGGAFGGKTYQPLSPVCALFALKTGRPVRMEMTREEVLRDSRPAPESHITVKMGVTKQGILTAASASLIYDAGAFPEMSHAMFVSHNLFGQYRVPNVQIDVKDVLTNKVPSAYYRAPAAPQLHYAVESQMDMIAEALEIDPVRLRIQNVACEGDTLPNGDPLPRVGFKQALERMAEYLREKEKSKEPNRGRGVACGFWRGATGGFGAYVRVNNNGTVNLITGVTDISGSRTSIAQIVAEELDLPLDKVLVINGDTDTAPWATMSVGSMTVYSLSVAAYRACQDVKEQLGRIAASKLGVAASEVEYVNGGVQVKADPAKRISFMDLARSTTVMFGGTGPIIGRGSVVGLPAAPTLSVHVVDVEVDKETGSVRILSYAVVQDVGRAINPLLVEGQIQGAVTQGIGWALMEQYVFDKGVLQNTNLLDYRMPTATDVPMIDVVLVEVDSSEGIYGLRHVGEPPMVPALAAVANAVHDAIGIRMLELPMTPETVLKALKKRDSS